jgi:hypothetical protein
MPVLRTCLDEAEQCDFVCRSVLRHREEGVALKQQAVLFRAAHHSDLSRWSWPRRNIPFVKYGGLKFLEAAHVKDALSLLRVLENPFDEVSWFRVLQLPEGVGPATARRLMDELGVRRTDDDQPSPLLRFLEEPVGVPKAAVSGVQELRAALGDCLVDESLMPPAAQLDRIRAFLEPVFARRYDAAASRTRDLEQLELLASGYETRGRFVSELTLDPAVLHRRPRGPAAPGRGLARALDDPFGEGAGVGRGPRDPRRRRHDPVGHGDRRRRRDRGGTPAALRRHDPGARRVDRVVPAAVLPPAARPGGSRTATRSSRASCPRRSARTSRRSAPTCSRCPTPTRSTARRTSTRSSPGSGRSDRYATTCPSDTTPSCWICTTRSCGANGSACATPSPPGSATGMEADRSRRRSSRRVRRAGVGDFGSVQGDMAAVLDAAGVTYDPRSSTSWSNWNARTSSAGSTCTTTSSRPSRRSGTAE